MKFRDDQLQHIISLVDAIQPSSRETALVEKVSSWQVLSDREERQNKKIDALVDLIDEILNGVES